MNSSQRIPFILFLVLLSLPINSFALNDNTTLIGNDIVFSTQFKNKNLDCAVRGNTAYSGKFSSNGKSIIDIRIKKANALKRKLKNASSSNERKEINNKISKLIKLSKESNAACLAAAPKDCKIANKMRIPVLHDEYPVYNTPISLSGRHRFTHGFSVESVLTLTPCTLMELTSTNRIIVSDNGSIKAKGSPGKEIIFTSAHTSNPTAGDWDGFSIGSLSLDINEFDYVIVEYARSGYEFAGNEGVLFVSDGSHISINNSVFRHLASSAVHLSNYEQGVQLKSFKNNKFDKIKGDIFNALNENNLAVIEKFTVTNSNSSNVIRIDHTLDQNVVLKNFGIPYLFTAGNFAADYANVTINAGVRLLIDRHNWVSIDDSASLNFNGTPQSPITIEHYQPNALWGHISFRTTPGITHTFTNVIFKNAGYLEDEVIALNSGVIAKFSGVSFINTHSDASCDVNPNGYPSNGSVINLGNNQMSICPID